MKSIAMHTDQTSQRRLRRLLLLLVALFALLAVVPAQAQSCTATSSPDLDFGTVTETSTTDAQTSVNVNCNSGFGGLFFTYYFRICVFVDQGTPSGLNPRRMTNDNGAYMNYNLYSDAARSQLLGPIGSTPVYSATLSIAPWVFDSATSMTLYGRVPAGQNIPAPYPYHGLPAGSVVRYASSTSAYPSVTACQGSGTQDAFSWTGVRATYANLGHRLPRLGHRGGIQLDGRPRHLCQSLHDQHRDRSRFRQCHRPADQPRPDLPDQPALHHRHGLEGAAR
mgnify:CR=1 FL=1